MNVIEKVIKYLETLGTMEACILINQLQEFLPTPISQHDEAWKKFREKNPGLWAI